MRRLSIATLLVGMLFNGCAVVVEDGVAAEPAPISPVQFLRPQRDSETGRWVAAWVDPDNYQFTGVSARGEDATQ